MDMPFEPLVIFDCDGVLVDSEPLSIRALIETVEAYGGRLDEAAAYRQFLGRSLTHMVAELLANFGIEADAGFLERMRIDLYARFERELQPIAGVDLAVRTMPWRCCVASSSQLERIRLSLRLTGLVDLFEPNIYSASMVENGKPAPDLFLHAARAMGVEPAHCIVVEDSPAGILAAKRAGMAVFAFTGGGHTDRDEYRREIAELAPDVTFSAMADLIAHVARYAEGGNGLKAKS